MIKRILITIVIVLVIVIIFEVISLLRINASMSRYARFWQQKSAQQGEILYIAIGDSTAQSIGASNPMNGYVGLLADKIEEKTGKKVRVVNLSVSGATVQDAIDDQLPQLHKYKPDLITVGIGANDVARNKLENFPEQYEYFASKLPKGTFITNMPYFGGRYRRNTEALLAGDIIKSNATTYGLKLVNLQDPLRKNDSILNYASDFFHPSNRAYKIWAEAFWQEIEPSL